MKWLRFSVSVFCTVVASHCTAAPVIESDVCVYGGTSGGAIAAVTAARLGKTVALLSFNNHIGGMTSGGLGVTDKGNAASIGGFALEFYKRVGMAYGSNSPVYYFEPHVAEQTFNSMLTEAGVVVYTNQQLASVTMSNLVITQITMSDGTIYRAKEFIDTTYEGDLMAMAGVSYTFGRESSTAYGESSAGGLTPGNSYSYDPYVIAGSPSSGLLNFVQSNAAPVLGQADPRLQTYNYRLCLTQNATNQIPIAPPSGSAESQYELFRRYLAARVATDGSVNLNQIIDVQTLIPNGKTDINANGELSTDYVGGNLTYATNTYAGREAIRQAHENYIRGYLYFLATSTNVPSNVRTQMQSWQLCKDEFKDSGGWPHQMYVREARRMVSDYVMTQDNCVGNRVALDPICLASYGMDCHPVQRIASSGLCKQEGGLGGNVQNPYAIEYRSIVPRNGECQNLFCTFALSASHVAFASIRMEPVFMMTSQAAGTAAAFCIDDQSSCQQVNYPKLAAQLRADGQLLTWGCTSEYLTNTITLDQGNTCYVTSTGAWTPGANSGGWLQDYWHDGATGKGQKSVTYTPNLPTNGTYAVSLWWVEASNRATNTPVIVTHANGSTRVLVNQQLPSGGWFKLLQTNFNAGTASSVTISNIGTLSGTYCIADGVRWTPVGFNLPPPPGSPPPVVEVVASDAAAGEFGTNYGRFTIVRNNDPNLLPLTVNYTLSGTATNGLDCAALGGTVILAAGALATNITIVPLGGTLNADAATVTLTLQPSTNFNLTSLNSATVTLADRPLHSWQRANFSPAQLADPSISGDSAIPEHDGLPNLLKYAMGIPPFIASPTNNPAAQIDPSGYFVYTYTRSKTATDVSLTLEESHDLKTWNPTGSNETTAVTDLGLLQQVTVKSLISGKGDVFFRFRANRL